LIVSDDHNFIKLPNAVCPSRIPYCLYTVCNIR